MSEVPRKATYEDVLAAPAHVVAEVLDGTLYTHPRPPLRQAYAKTAIGAEIGLPFKRGRGGPGGWITLDEPELHLGRGPDIVVPDSQVGVRPDFQKFPTKRSCHSLLTGLVRFCPKPLIEMTAP